MIRQEVDYTPRWRALTDRLDEAGYDATLTADKAFGIDTYTVRIDRADVGSVTVTDRFDGGAWKGFVTTLRDWNSDVLAARFSGMSRDNVVADVARYVGVLDAVSQA